MKLKRYKLIFTVLAALALLATSCSKIDDGKDDVYSSASATGKTVSVTIPIGIAETETIAATSRTTAATNAKLATSPEEGFTVSFDEPTPTTTTDAPSTRTIAQELSNVWVLQFDNNGNNVSTANTGSLASGKHLTVPALKLLDDCTIYVVANGPASGLSTTNLTTLDAFESSLYTTTVTDATKLPLSGKLAGVSVVDLGDGKGGVLKLMDASPTSVMKRMHAEVTLTVDFDVTDYTLTGAELYNVPKGATYGWNSATTTFPDNTIATNFNYTNTAAAGLTSLATTTTGTKTTYKWFIGNNRRGEVAGLTAQTDRNNGKAPAYATFARVTLTSSKDAGQKLMYDIYLGSGEVTNFDLLRNHTYTVTTVIKGTADFQEARIVFDARVSGVGGPFPIWLTDSKADSPFLISPKSMEPAAKIVWGDEATSIPAIQDIFNGKTNTDAIMSAITTTVKYPAAQHCRTTCGPEWDLPAQAQLMLMWIYLPAIPANDRPVEDEVWSSTENGRNAWYVNFLNGGTAIYSKFSKDYVRCVREK